VSQAPDCTTISTSRPSTPQASEIPVVYTVGEDYLTETEYIPQAELETESLSSLSDIDPEEEQKYLELGIKGWSPKPYNPKNNQHPRWSDYPEAPNFQLEHKTPVIPPTFQKHKNNKANNTSSSKKPSKVHYKQVSRDLATIKKTSYQNSYYTKRYSDILRNQLVRAHSHSALEIVLQFERYRKKNPHNKDPTWFLEKIATDLFIFSDELQTVSNLPEADRQTSAFDFEELAQPGSVGPFIGFVDPRLELQHFQHRHKDQSILRK
jgi:hypothetical protein